LGLAAFTHVAVGAGGDGAVGDQGLAGGVGVALVDEAVAIVVLAVAQLDRPRVARGVPVVAVGAGVPAVLVGVLVTRHLGVGAVLGRAAAARDRRAGVDGRVGVVAVELAVHGGAGAVVHRPAVAVGVAVGGGGWRWAWELGGGQPS